MYDELMLMTTSEACAGSRAVWGVRDEDAGKGGSKAEEGARVGGKAGGAGGGGGQKAGGRRAAAAKRQAVAVSTEARSAVSRPCRITSGASSTEEGSEKLSGQQTPRSRL